MVNIPQIPKSLTKADWDKNKGIFAKMAGETGIGAALQEMATAYSAVNWTRFDGWAACQAVKSKGPIEEARKAAVAEFKMVEKLREKVVKVRDLATKTQGEFKKSKTIPSSSTKHVESMATAADTFWIMLKGNSSFATDSMKSFDDVAAELDKKINVAMGVLKKYIGSLTKDGKAVLAAPTVELYKGGSGTGFHQGVRGLAAALAIVPTPEIQEFYKGWRPFVVDAFLPKDGKEAAQKVVIVLKQLQKLTALV